MKEIIIRDLGPIAEADIFLKDINVIIGEQSIGKSCVLKVSCFCTWVEKRIAIAQNARRTIIMEIIVWLRQIVK